MVGVKEYKCPCCGGAIEFNSAGQNMKCPYCDTEFDIETLTSFENELNQDSGDNMQWQTVGGTEWASEEAAAMRSYTCNSCGGEIIGDETTAATECPFCGNPVMMPGQFTGTLRPDLVIPFKLSKEDAKKALQNHYKGKRLLPKAFKTENHINEVKGIYVPFWLYDTDAQASIRYKATKVRFWSDANYNYTETSYFAVRRSGSVGFEKVPVDGSTKMEDVLMESIEPFDCSQAVPFHTAYLSGYLADKYDVDSETSIQKANQRIKRSTEDAFASTVQGYATVVPESSNVTFQNGTAKYALYPVWLLNTTWQGKKYTFVMNGQTGKMAGDLPMDKGAFWRWFLGVAGIGTAVVFALLSLIWLL